MNPTAPLAPSASDVHRHLPADRRALSTTRGVLLFAVFLLGYLGAFLGAAALPGWPLQLAASVLLTAFLSWLALLGHDAGHGSLTRSPALNAVLGRIAFHLSWMPFTSWVVSHNRHHAFTNVRGLDRFWAPLSPQEFRRLPRWRRRLERVYRTPFGVVVYALVELWGRALLGPDGSRRRHEAVGRLDRLAVVATAALQVVGVLLWRRWLEYPGSVTSVLACAVLPFVQVAWWTGFVGFLHHNHPQTRWYADRREWSFFRGQVEATVHVETPWLLGWLLGNALEHTAHHAAPGVPLTALPECQRRLERAFPESVPALGLFECLRVFAVCKLYDYERHCWADFDGRPTTDEREGPTMTE